MKNQIKYINDKQAEVTKAFAKKAVIFGTPEYKLWREYKKDFPEAEMVTKTRASKPRVIPTRNLSYANMVKFIKEQDNAAELLAEFKREREMSYIQTSPYRSVLAWFLGKFENYDSYKGFLERIAEEARRKEAEKENDNAAA